MKLIQKIGVLPDILLLVLSFAVLAVALWRDKEQGRESFYLAWGGLLGIFLLLLMLASGWDEDMRVFGSYLLTGSGIMFRLIFVGSALAVILLSRSYFVEKGNLRGDLRHAGEFFATVMLATLGMFAVVSATDLLTLFVGLELATVPLYVLTAFHKGDEQSAEAATKFILMGAFSTAVMLFGYSFVYGAVGGVGYADMAAFAAADPDNLLLRFGAMLVCAAIGFKLTLVPFHMWAPDVYEGAPTPVAALLSVSSKTTAVAFLMVLLYGPLAPLHAMLAEPLLILAACTMTVGNLGAMRQRNLRRFMAYSSIAQAGYIVMAMVGDAATAKAAIVFYLAVYAAANYAVFFIIAIIGEKRPEELPSLRGLGRQSPVLAAILMLAMFSLAGIPPLAGFIGKFLLFAEVARQGYLPMVLFAALNSTLSLYYYLLLVKEAYILQPEAPPLPLTVSVWQRYSLAPLALCMLLPGIVPSFSAAIGRLVG